MDLKNMVKCKACTKDIAKGVKKCPDCGKDQRNFFMRHKIVTGILVLIIFGGIGSATGGGEDKNLPEDEPKVVVEETELEEIEVEEVVAMDDGEDLEEAEIEEEVAVEETKVEDDVPREYASALNKAETYAERMHMSKASIYNQLTSEYGEKFPEEAAQYAMDNLVADWNENALKKAETYATSMDMSTTAIYDQLISEYGEQFTAEEAQYAVDNLD